MNRVGYAVIHQYKHRSRVRRGVGTAPSQLLLRLMVHAFLVISKHRVQSRLRACHDRVTLRASAIVGASDFGKAK